MEKMLYHPLVRKGTLRHLAAGTFAKCPAARHRHFFVTRSSDLHALPLQHVVGRWHRGMRCSWGSVILGAVLSRDFQDCLHAGQPLDISSSIYSCSAMVVISFLSILGTSFRMLRLVRPRSLVTWCSSVRVLILSDFITRSSRFSLCTSQLGWQGMTDLLEAVGEIGIRVVLRFSGLRSDLRALISMTVFFYGGLISCFLIT